MARGRCGWSRLHDRGNHRLHLAVAGGLFEGQIVGGKSFGHGGYLWPARPDCQWRAGKVSVAKAVKIASDLRQGFKPKGAQDRLTRRQGFRKHPFTAHLCRSLNAGVHHRPIKASTAEIWMARPAVKAAKVTALRPQSAYPMETGCLRSEPAKKGFTAQGTARALQVFLSQLFQRLQRQVKTIAQPLPRFGIRAISKPGTEPLGLNR